MGALASVGGESEKVNMDAELLQVLPMCGLWFGLAMVVFIIVDHFERKHHNRYW